MPLVRAAASLAVHSTPLWGHAHGGTPHHPVELLLLLWTEHLPTHTQSTERHTVFRTVTGEEQCRANVALA